MNKTLLLETLRAVRSGTIQPRERLDAVIDMVERWKPPGRKKRAPEKKAQEFIKLAHCFRLIRDKMEARKSYPYKPAIYDLAIDDVANDMGMKQSVLKKKLPEYMFYLREPIENVPPHMRCHVEKATERFREMAQLFSEGKLSGQSEKLQRLSLWQPKTVPIKIIVSDDKIRKR